MLGMTRTTGVPSGSRDSMNAVVMPAARETTSAPGRTWAGDLVEQGAHVLRLDHEDAGCRRLAAAVALSTTSTP